MLKTSSTKSAKPRKGVVGISSGGKNKAEPVGKHEVDSVDGVDGVDGGSSRGGNFDMTFQVARWRFEHCSSAKTVAFNCESEADHEKPIPIASD